MTNATTVYNSFGEMKIDKQKSTSRIDTVDAVVDAITMMIKVGDVEPLDHEMVADEYLKMMGWG